MSAPAASAPAASGRELVTNDGAASFCSVRLDGDGVVTEILYLGTEDVEADNWACLLGLPEAALNNLAPRFDEGLVPDLAAFLRQEWATALYHDRFAEFAADTTAALHADAQVADALDQLRQTPAYAAQQLTPKDLMERLPEDTKTLVRTKLLDYVAANQNHLDMYLVPGSAVMKAMDEAKAR